MKYLEFLFTITPASSDAYDLLSGLTAEVGFESFEKFDNPDEPMKGYIPADLFDQETLDGIVANFPFAGTNVTYQYSEMEDRDWNAEWEKNYFQPLEIDDLCVVSATFHKDVKEARYNIKINPRMSFGTGHHATTSQMMREILQADCKGKSVLDMGCGTGILGILACMCGAAECLSIDVDEWCIKNTEENIALNHIDNLNVVLGSAASLDNYACFDLLLCNIHLNVIVADMPYYARHLKPGAVALFSGFYEKDLPKIVEAAGKEGLSLCHSRTENDWCCARFVKQAEA
ncbi:MAG: 50S ribosomal protein L11 methyltransferase [Alloprevotella sp.]|nr:50S ribosomal protein L11 methyltransferase [Alloprevotella sp.]